MEADKEHPADNEHPNETLKDLKHNLIVNIADGGFFGLGMGFASFAMVLPLFVSTMTNSAILIGLIPAIHSIGWQLPQLLTADRVARQKRFKPMTLFITVQERLPYLGLALVAWRMTALKNQTALLLTFALLTWQGLGAGLTATAWQSLIAKIIPSDRRGTFFGAQAAAANLLASLSALAAGFILEAMDSPADYVLCFLLASLSMVFSWFFLAQTREPEKAPEDIFPNPGDFWRGLGAILRRDRNFRWFLAARMLSQLAVMGFAFYSVYLVHHLGVSEAEVGVITFVLLGTQIVANPLMGWLGDRRGHRALMEIGLVAAVFSALLAWQATGPAWFYPIAMLAGISLVGVWTIGISMILEFGSEAERPAYIGLANTLVAPANILAPFLGGWLADTAGYPVTFLASALAGVATLAVFHFLVRDPKTLR